MLPEENRWWNERGVDVLKVTNVMIGARSIGDDTAESCCDYFSLVREWAAGRWRRHDDGKRSRITSSSGTGGDSAIPTAASLPSRVRHYLLLSLVFSLSPGGNKT